MSRGHGFGAGKALFLPAVSAAAGALFAAGLLRKGVVMGPDSWAYWEGSVSVIQVGSYSYFGGEPITSFPPLFSWVLALFQHALGVSVRTLAIAVVALVAAASFGWTTLYALLTGDRIRVSLPDALAAIYIPATLAIYAQTLLSETLWLALLPLLLLAALVPAGARRPWWGYVSPILACVVLGLMLLCRNVTVALLPGVFLVLARQAIGRTWYRRAALALAVIAGAIIPWYWVRRALVQLGNHPIGTSKHGVLANTAEMARGLAYAFGPTQLSVGAILLCGVCAVILWDAVAGARTAHSPGAPSRLRLVEFAVLGLGGLVGLFSATHVGEPIAGRFVVFAALSLSLVVFAAGQAAPEVALRRALTVVGILLTAVALYRVGIKYRLAGREQEVTPLNVTITSSHWSGPPRTSGAYVLVAPPSYPWMRRGGKVD